MASMPAVTATTATTPAESSRTPAAGPWTRFAPAPTGYLHLGHVANAIMVWGLAGLDDGRVLLRIEDHDRQRCRPEYDAALREDLAWLGFVPDAGPVRQTDADALAAYDAALDRLRGEGRAYGCTCTRATFTDWARAHGGPWHGPGCPGDCRVVGAADTTIRVALGGGPESWDDAWLGRRVGEVGAVGDLVARDRHGNRTYGFAVVVDDARQGIGLVVRGVDLLEATAGQIRLARVLGRTEPPRFAHHPLIRRADGRKLSKADGATAVRELRAAGRRAEDVIGEATAAIGLIDGVRPVGADEVATLVGAGRSR
jgi:glutamyl-Q tRNA(Asp) synthetase